MRPIILKLLKQESVTQPEWQDLFYSVQVCLWDDKGPPKLRDALQEDIMDFIQQAQQVRVEEDYFCIQSKTIPCIFMCFTEITEYYTLRLLYRES